MTPVGSLVLYQGSQECPRSLKPDDGRNLSSERHTGPGASYFSIGDLPSITGLKLFQYHISYANVHVIFI